MIVRIPFEAPECDRYDENKHKLVEWGLKLLSLSDDSSVVSESSSQEAIMSTVSTLCVCVQGVPIKGTTSGHSHEFKVYQ